MKYFIALMLSLVTSHAATHTEYYGLPIQRTSALPTPSYASSHLELTQIYLGRCIGSDCVDHTPEWSVQSICDWDKVKIASQKIDADTYNYFAQVKLDASNWPSSTDWSTHDPVTCTYTVGSETFKAVFDITAAVDVPHDGNIPSVSNSVDFTLDPVEAATYNEHYVVMETASLPSGTYTERDGDNPIQCKKNGNDWTHVIAMVEETPDLLIVRYQGDAVPGTGTCRIVRNGSNYDVTVILPSFP